MNLVGIHIQNNLFTSLKTMYSVSKHTLGSEASDTTSHSFGT